MATAKKLAKVVKKMPAKKVMKKVEKVEKVEAVKRPVRKSMPQRSYTGPREPSLTTDVQAAVVDEIPAPYATNPRIARYRKVLVDVREQVGAGKPVLIATFIGRGGALTAKRSLETGKTPVDGAIEDWEFTARGLGKGQGSALYAMLRED